MYQGIAPYSAMDTNARWAIVIRKAEYLDIIAFEPRIGLIATLIVGCYSKHYI